MKYTIHKDERPVYLQLYKQLRRDIIEGIYQYGSKLPSKRLLAEETGVSTVTVEHAYALLCDEGYATSSQRSGYFVAFRQTDGFAAATMTPLMPHIPHTARHYPDFSLSILSKTMRKVLTDYEEAILEKSPNSGCTELREALQQYLARNRIFAIESPSYKQIEQVYLAAEICYESLPLTQDGIDSQALSASNAHVLHTTPYRSFPSGVTASASKRHEYIRWATATGRYIIEDDFESEFSVFAKPTETLFSLSERDNVIYLNTFSKTISPALRIAYMVLPESLLTTFSEKLGFYSCTVSTYMQLVLAQLLNNGDFERHINRVRRNKRKVGQE